MQTGDILNQWTSFSKLSIKPMITFNTLANRNFERLAKHSLEIINDAMTTSANYMQNLLSSKKMEDIASLQTQMIKETGSKAITYAQKSLEAIVDSSTELSKWFEDGMNQAVSAVDKSKSGTGSTGGKL